MLSPRTLLQNNRLTSREVVGEAGVPAVGRHLDILSKPDGAAFEAGLTWTPVSCAGMLVASTDTELLRSALVRVPAMDTRQQHSLPVGLPLQDFVAAGVCIGNLEDREAVVLRALDALGADESL